MTTLLQPHRLTLESSGASSGEASAWARALAQEAGLSEARTYALDLCVVELVGNIVDHSYRGQPGEIRLELELGPSTAVLTILDRGPAFDPLSVPAPVKTDNLDEVTVGGFGIHLVRSSADRCRYERRDGSNVFTAWFGTGG